MDLHENTNISSKVDSRAWIYLFTNLNASNRCKSFQNGRLERQQRARR